MSLAEQVMRRVEPAAIRYYQWRGDPLARWMRPQTKTDPYPLYADIRRRPLVRSALGPWMTANHAAAESILRDRRFSSSPCTSAVTGRPLTRPAIPARSFRPPTCSRWTRPTTPASGAWCPVPSPRRR